MRVLIADVLIGDAGSSLHLRKFAHGVEEEN